MFRGVECDRSLGKLSMPHLLAWVLFEVPDLGHSFPKWCQVKYKLFDFISTISIDFYLFSRLFLWFSWTIASCTCDIYPPPHTDIPDIHIEPDATSSGKTPEARDGLKRVKDVCEVGEVSPRTWPRVDSSPMRWYMWPGRSKEFHIVWMVGWKYFFIHEKNQHFGPKKRGFLKTSVVYTVE